MQVRDEIAATGVPVVFHNVNAADEDEAPRRSSRRQRRCSTSGARRARTRSSRCCSTRSPSARRCRTSTDEPDEREVSQKQLEMTADVMAHSLVYWMRDLFHAGLLANGSASSR